MTDPQPVTPPSDTELPSSQPIEGSFALNRANWDERAPLHEASPGYAVARFLTEPSHLSDVVRFDLPRLGQVEGLDGVHLQCHIGTDTISLARLGARMTGLDFSPPALAAGRRLAAGCGLDVDFVEAEVYHAVEALGGSRFDLVYTGIGALCWLPRIEPWAEVVAGLLRPGGRLFLRETHPVLWTVDDERSDVLALRYPYYEHREPFVTDESDSYVETTTKLTRTLTHSWNHGLGEIITALLRHGLRITALVEHDTVPYDALPGQLVEFGGGEYRLAQGAERLPMTYTVQAVKPG